MPRRKDIYMIIGIMGAMPDEVDQLCAKLENVTVEPYGGVEYHRGTLAGKQVVVCCAGMGKANAAATTQVLITRYGAEKIIFSGIAGNLNTHLHINDVVLGGTLRYLDTDMRLVGQWKPGTADQPVEEFHSDGRLIEVADKVLTDLNVHHITGIIATGNYFVDDPKKVELVIRETGADAVEMEGAAVAHVAARNDLPVLVIRALSDNADTDYVEFKEFDISEYADTAAKIAVNIVKRM